MQQSWTKVLRQLFTKTNAFELTIIFCIWMKTPFSSIVTPSPLNNIAKCSMDVFFFGEGGYLSWGERGKFRLRKKLLIFSTTFVHNCRYSAMCKQVNMHALAVLSNAPTHFIQSLLIKIFCMMPSGFCLFMESIARFTSIWVSWLNDMISFLN